MLATFTAHGSPVRHSPSQPVVVHPDRLTQLALVLARERLQETREPDPLDATHSVGFFLRDSEPQKNSSAYPHGETVGILHRREFRKHSLRSYTVR